MYCSSTIDCEPRHEKYFCQNCHIFLSKLPNYLYTLAGSYVCTCTYLSITVVLAIAATISFSHIKSIPIASKDFFFKINEMYFFRLIRRNL